MKDFYSIESNFDFMYNDISLILSDNILESTLAEGWLEDFYVSNKYDTTRAIEKFAADIVVSKLKKSDIPQDDVVNIIDNKLELMTESHMDFSLEDKLYMVEALKNVEIDEMTLHYILEDFELSNIIESIKLNYLDENYKSFDKSFDEDVKELLSLLENINYNIRKNINDRHKLVYIKSCNERVLYKNKSVIQMESFHKDISSLYPRLEALLENQTDEIINYTANYLGYTNNLVDYILNVKYKTTQENFVYDKAVEEFNNLVESLFFDESDEDMNIKDLVKLYKVTEALCEYESTMEASSRIITKGTEKVTRAIGNASSKSHGMAKADSKIGQIKRGARIIDDRASGAINRKIDAIINITKDAKREKLITGKNTVKLGKALKTIIALLGSKHVAFKVLGPIKGTAVMIVTMLAGYALSKRTEEREKKRILLDLETELKITREKIEDAKGDNAKQQKYELMRIEATLEKEITRIKHGLRYY